LLYNFGFRAWNHFKRFRQDQMKFFVELFSQRNYDLQFNSLDRIIADKIPDFAVKLLYINDRSQKMKNTKHKIFQMSSSKTDKLTLIFDNDTSGNPFLTIIKPFQNFIIDATAVMAPLLDMDRYHLTDIYSEDSNFNNINEYYIEMDSILRKESIMSASTEIMEEAREKIKSLLVNMKKTNTS
jgi:hypothetical protein